jgi:hypothetical protein
MRFGKGLHMVEFYSVQLIGCDVYYWHDCGGVLSWGYGY